MDLAGGSVLLDLYSVCSFCNAVPEKRRADPRVFHWGNPAWYAAVQPLNQPLYGKVQCARFKESDSSDTQNMEDTDSAFSKGCVKSFE